MSTLDALLPQFDREMALTRRVIERIPTDRLDWKPHPKSTSFVGLGRHLAHMLTWGTHALTEDATDVANRKPMEPTPTLGDVLRIFLTTFGRDNDAVDFLVAFGRLWRWLLRRLRRHRRYDAQRREPGKRCAPEQNPLQAGLHGSSSLAPGFMANCLSTITNTVGGGAAALQALS